MQVLLQALDQMPMDVTSRDGFESSSSDDAHIHPGVSHSIDEPALLIRSGNTYGEIHVVQVKHMGGGRLV